MKLQENCFKVVYKVQKIYTLSLKTHFYIFGKIYPGVCLMSTSFVKNLKYLKKNTRYSLPQVMLRGIMAEAE